VLQNAVLTLLLVVMGVALLYAYRSQTPSVPEVDVTQALRDINSGRVRAVTIAGTVATLEFRDSPAHREQTVLSNPDTVLARAVIDYNAATPSQPIELRYEQGGGQPIGVIGSVVLGLLPVVLIGGFFVYMMRTRRAA
jgi:ATP-dependent Zn protease